MAIIEINTMANQNVYPFGQNGHLPSGYPIVNDLTTGGADKALSAEMGKELADMFQSVRYDGKNLYNPETDTTGKYLSVDTTLHDNVNYNFTDYIEVIPTFKYNLSGINGNDEVSYIGSNSAQIGFYDASKTLISQTSGDKQTITVPANARYIRVSVNVANYSNVMIEQGDERTEYEAYSPGSVMLRKVITDEIGNYLPQKFSSCRGTGTVTTSARIIRLPITCHIIKNSFLSAEISGTVEGISLGVGVNSSNGVDYAGHWVELDATQVKHYWWNGASVLLETFNHGLTLTQKTSVSISTVIDGEQKTKLIITTDLGNTFSQELVSWGVGKPYFRNGNTSASLDVALSFMPMDITKKLWLWGDSYVNFATDARWPYYLVTDKKTDFLSNSQPGLSGANAYTDLLSVLKLGYKPSVLVWTLGMNGDNDTISGNDYVINSTQKAVIDNVVALCKNNNITLIIGTVPTVPSRQRTGFCNYVRSLGVRYIDFAAAVGATSAGVWNTGLLDPEDNTHPTPAGARVLCAKALLDCPEFSIKD